MQIIEKKLTELKEYEKNPRRNDQAVDAVAASIRNFGFKVPIIIDRDGVIVAGHTRLKAARKIGLETVPCIIADDLSPEQIQAFRLADNKTAELAEWDPDLLLQELGQITIDMAQFGFDDSDIPEIDGEVYEDDYEEPEKLEPRTKLGDRYRLGDHILMCGDSTKEEDVLNLIGGGQIDLCVTDPPYNVALGTESGHALRPSEAKQLHRRTDGLVIANDDWESDEEFRDFLRSAFENVMKALKPGGAFYIWFASTRDFDFYEAAREAGMEIRQQLIWVKNVFALGRQDYQWRHEPCMYGWKDGAAHYFIDSRTESTIYDDSPDLEHITKADAVELLRAIYEGGVASTTIYEKKPTASKLHPTMKPVALIGYQIANSSHRGETVLDLFGGSGTTLIACEQLGRRCYMMEYDPHYCDVIIDRWEQFTGRKAERIDGQV